MSHFPAIEGVETPLGPSESIWATSETHIGLRGTFTINRVPYNVRLDLHLRDGVWQEGSDDSNSSRWGALMIDRDWDWSKGKRPDTSSAARRKARETLVPWLASYATGGGYELVRQAGVIDRERKLASAREKVEQLQAEILKAEAELASLSDH